MSARRMAREGERTAGISDRARRLRIGLAALALVATACRSHEPSVLQPSRAQGSIGGTSLFPVPKEITEACRYSVARDDWRALCPTILPRPFVGQPPLFSPGVLVGKSPPVINIGYGAPVEGGSGTGLRRNLWRNEPCGFLHFDIQQEGVYRPPRWHPKVGHKATLGGRRGWLRPAESRSYDASAYFSNHVRFFFEEAGEHYVVTLHDFGPNTVKLLSALIAELEPVEPLPKPLPASVPSPCHQYWQTAICRRGPVADVTVAGDVVWATKPESNKVVRIDPSTGRELGPAVRVRYPTRAVADKRLWVLGWKRHDLPLLELDPSSGRIVRTISLGHVAGTGMAADDGTIWITDGWRDALIRVDASDGSLATVGVGRGASAVAVASGSVWVTNTGDGMVSRVDATTNKVEASIPVGRYPQGVATTPGAVWVSNTGDGTVSRIDPATNRLRAIIKVGGFPIGMVDLYENGR
jgi:YVTN family beta-propeller protein